VPLADATLDDAGRRDLHRLLATVLAESAARNPAAQMEVALHLERGARPTEARAHALAAAAFAGSVGALRERAEALRLAKRVSGALDGAVAVALAVCYLELREFDQLAWLCSETAQQPDLPDEIRNEFRYLQIAADQHSGRVPLHDTCIALKELLSSESGSEFAHRRDAMTLLMRTADRTGDVLLVRNIARAQRRLPVGGTKPSAQALFSAAYVFTKQYLPLRAFPLLEIALRQAEAEQNWELAHACRDGLGICLKQLGRYSDSMEHFSHNLAFARRTLNPQAEATSLVNIAVTEMAMGSYDRAATHLDESAQIDAQYPKWPGRPYRIDNQAELALEIDRVTDAAAGFESALDSALSMQLWRLSVSASAGLAICAVRLGDYKCLGTYARRIESLLSDRAQSMAERWKVEGALAWDTSVNRGEPDCAAVRLRSARRELSRRDVDHWLWLELETIHLQEFLTGATDVVARQTLAELGRRYCASGIVRQAEKRLAE